MDRTGPRRDRYWKLTDLLAGAVVTVVCSFVAVYLQEMTIGFAAACPWIVFLALWARRFVSRQRGPTAFFALGILLVWGALVAYSELAPRIEMAVHALPFETARWQRNRTEQGEWPDRQRMVRDLLDQGRLNGLDRAGVRELLGHPDDEDTVFSWRYDLGQHRRRQDRIEFLSVVFRFDERDKVRWAFINDHRRP